MFKKREKRTTNRFTPSSPVTSVVFLFVWLSVFSPNSSSYCCFLCHTFPLGSILDPFTEHSFLLSFIDTQPFTKDTVSHFASSSAYILYELVREEINIFFSFVIFHLLLFFVIFLLFICQVTTVVISASLLVSIYYNSSNYVDLKP